MHERQSAFVEARIDTIYGSFIEFLCNGVKTTDSHSVRMKLSKSKSKIICFVVNVPNTCDSKFLAISPSNMAALYQTGKFAWLHGSYNLMGCLSPSYHVWANRPDYVRTLFQLMLNGILQEWKSSHEQKKKSSILFHSPTINARETGIYPAAVTFWNW